MKIITKAYAKFCNLKLFQFILSSIFISFIFESLPDKLFNYKMALFRIRKWEKRGDIYIRIFKVKKWKDKVIELSDIIKSVFPKKHIYTYSKEYLEKYLINSCRAKLAHLTIIFSTLYYVFINEISTFFNMFFIATILNLPYIIIQRFNRPRIIKYLNHMDILTSHHSVPILDQ